MSIGICHEADTTPESAGVAVVRMDTVATEVHVVRVVLNNIDRRRPIVAAAADRFDIGTIVAARSGKKDDARGIERC